MKCAFCNKEFKTTPLDVILLCPHCYTSQTTNGEKFSNHFIIRANYDQNAAQEKMFDTCVKTYKVPANLQSKVNFQVCRLIYHPFWVVKMNISTNYRGKKKEINFHDAVQGQQRVYRKIEPVWKPESSSIKCDYTIFLPGDSIRNFKPNCESIPLHWAEQFDSNLIKEHNGSILHSRVSEKDAVQEAHEISSRKQVASILDEIDFLEWRTDEYITEDAFLIHLPVWHLEYTYNYGKYMALISGASCHILLIDCPKSLTYRQLRAGLGFILLILGSALLIPSLGIGAIIIGGLVSGSILIALGVSFFLKASDTFSK